MSRAWNFGIWIWFRNLVFRASDPDLHLIICRSPLVFPVVRLSFWHQLIPARENANSVLCIQCFRFEDKGPALRVQGFEHGEAGLGFLVENTVT